MSDFQDSDVFIFKILNVTFGSVWSTSTDRQKKIKHEDEKLMHKNEKYA